MTIASAPLGTPAPRPALWRRPGFWLSLILVVALFERVIALDRYPAPMNQDEACNAWSSWCLVKTGLDQDGAPWPIFYYHAFGENRSTLFLYFLVPFQYFGGLNDWTMRLPSAVAGVASIALMYYFASRWLGRWYGLLAAMLLALTGWHVQFSRWGHESAIVPLLVLGPLAALTAARFIRPLRSVTTPAQPRWGWALVAGAVFGVACYGYPALRLYLPITGVLLVLFFLKSWLSLLRTRQGALSLGLFLFGLTTTFGPLIYAHVADSDKMLKRGEQSWVWRPEDPTVTRIARVAGRYFGHFYPDFLFLKGDGIVPQSPPGGGVLEWHYAPLLIFGAAAALWNFRRSAAARLALLFLLVYPTGDCTSLHGSMHSLRSFPGLPGLVFASVVGVRGLTRLLTRFKPVLPRVWIGATVTAALVLHGRYLYLYYGPYPVICAVYNTFAPDLVAACRYVKPQLDRIDRVIVTPTSFNEAYVISLIALDFDPAAWLKLSKQYWRVSVWDVCTSFGQWRFPTKFTREGVMEYVSDLGPEARLAFFARPGEIVGATPSFVYRDLSNIPVLEVVFMTARDAARARFDPGIHTIVPANHPKIPPAKRATSSNARP